MTDRRDFASLNAKLRYVMFSAFSVRSGELPEDRTEVAAEAGAFFESLEDRGVTLRGVYDISGLRAEADYLIWWHADDAVEKVQAAYKDFRRTTALGRASDPFWSNVGLNRPAEFNKSHIPAVTADERPRGYVSVYPFVRSYDWYLLEESERRRILAAHGQAGREYPDVRANTIPAFALGDYEWVLAFEADELDRIVDLMRIMRATEARLHVREEVPFFTGPRVAIEELVPTLP